MGNDLKKTETGKKTTARIRQNLSEYWKKLIDTSTKTGLDASKTAFLKN